VIIKKVEREGREVGALKKSLGNKKPCLFKQGLGSHLWR
tara:strand:- start:22609 stop:22725 length:117 start_codon:yes stop_codon:yes gene_type:complete